MLDSTTGITSDPTDLSSADDRIGNLPTPASRAGLPTGYWLRPSAISGSRFGDLVKPPKLSFADEFSIPQQVIVLVFDKLRAAVSFLFKVYRRDMLVEPAHVVFPDASLESASVGPEEAQHSRLDNFRQILVGFLCGLSKKPSPPPLSFGMLRAPTLWSARAPKARSHFSKNGRYDISHRWY